MKKVVVISALCMGGVGLMAFKPFKVHTVPLNDVTAAYNAEKSFNLMDVSGFSKYHTSETTTSENVMVHWKDYCENDTDDCQKNSQSKIDELEKVLNKY